MKDYDSFAPFYDLAMGDREDVAVTLRKLLRRYHPKAKTLLEFGCGSGSLLRVLTKHYQCCGVDLSAGMIKVARKKVPAAALSVADITRVQLRKRFDVVLCAFDTINHIVQFSDWRRVFQRACEHLDPEGVFIFDINTERKLQRYADEPPFAEFVEDATATFEVTKTARSRFTIHVKVFKPSGATRYSMREMFVHEATYPVPRIVQTLSQYFERIHLIDLERAEASTESEELYFVCSKPKQRGRPKQWPRYSS
jgi:SAM-dependent methyltransferase